MNSTENTHLLDYVTNGLRIAAGELEKFQLQVGLGKMEAFDAYEELKKKYAHYTHELKLKAEEGKEKLIDLQAKFQDLQVQFNLGKAETIEAFQEQRKKILLAIHEVQVVIQSNPTIIKTYAYLLIALEKLKVKLDILSQQFEPTRERIVENLNNRKEQLEKVISDFKSKFNERTDLEERMDVFRSEISLAYEHFRKAFVN
jgi:predicted  nucleic acid-binding Zn-ribbon protein